jgi:transposase
LGLSSFTYAEASLTQSLPHWLLSHARMYEHFRGVPELTIPDNLRSGVSDACFYDPEINPSYRDLADHYGTIVLPTRIRKPRDKAKVEAAVLVAQRWILAVLRDRAFTSVAEMNQAIAPLLLRLNSRVMRHLAKSRAELWETFERPVLKPLPEKRYEFAAWARPKLNIDYHVEYEHHFYSAPHALIHQRLDLRATGETIELFLKGRRVASHVRSYVRGKYTTDPAHRPERHRAQAEWSPARMKAWAAKIGPRTGEVAERMFAMKDHPEQAYRSVLGLIRLAKHYTEARLESACAQALQIGSPSYRTVSTMLKQKREPGASSLAPSPPAPTTPVAQPHAEQLQLESQSRLAKEPHRLVRGKGYYH